MLRIALVGNPNSGKTSLFNALTGSLRPVANHSGVTVDATEAFVYDTHGHRHRLFDLPGACSLQPHDPEEAVLKDFLSDASSRPDRILCVIDANYLEKSLYLIVQVLHLKIPSAVVLTMENSAKRKGIHIDHKRLSEYLGVPVFGNGSLSSKTIVPIKHFIANDGFKVSHLDFLQSLNLTNAATLAYKKIDSWCENCIKNVYPQKARYDFDRILLHPFGGWIVLGVVVCLLFSTVFVLSDWAGCLFTSAYMWCGNLLKMLPEIWIRNLFLEGILGGVGNLLIFLPQFACLMFLLGILENTGYLARVSFLMERWMRYFGFSGKSFIPLMTCYSCTVPGLLNSRCIQNHPERKTLMFISSWISCAGRLPIYLFLISIMLFESAWWVKMLAVLGVYLFGTLFALLFAKILRKLYFKDVDHKGIFLEFPALKIPQLGYIFKLTCEHIKSFLKHAGSLILIFSVLLWFLLNIPINHSNNRDVEYTLVARIGKKLDPIFKPIGCDWKTGVSVLMSFGSRESFISSLGVMHNMDSHSSCRPLHVSLHSKKTETGQPYYGVPNCLSLIIFFMLSSQCLGAFVFLWRENGRIGFALKQFIFTNLIAYSLASLLYNMLK